MAGETPQLSGQSLRLALKLRPLSLADIDKRTKAARSAAALFTQLVEDLGGETRISAAQRQIAERASVLSAMVQSMEASWLSGSSPVDIADYTLATGLLRRLLMSLGLSRVARDVTPDPLTYAAERDAA